MSESTYKLDDPKGFSEEEKQSFLNLLRLQGKMKNPIIEKVNRCRLLCICKVDSLVVSIGAIKPKTNSDFNVEKADLDKMRDEFQIELGYCFTLSDFTRKGISSMIVKMLLDSVKDKNLVASTELRSDNSMIRILKKAGFRQYGKPWKSEIHEGSLGLFLKFA